MPGAKESEHMTIELQPAIEVTAFHEAGHAVAHFDLEIPIGYVTIVPKGDSLGRATGRRPRWFDPDEVSARMQWHVQREIVSLYAGPIAESKMTGAGNHAGAEGDHHTIVQLADCVVGGAEELQAFISWLEIRSTNLVEHRWFAIEAVAQALLNEKRMTGKRVAEVVRQSNLDAMARAAAADRQVLNDRS
jgi:hypothetical protein